MGTQGSSSSSNERKMNGCKSSSVAASEITKLLCGGNEGVLDQEILIGGVGLDYALVKCTDESAVDAIEMDPGAVGRFTCFFYFYAVCAGLKGHAVYARMFCEENGSWVEDAATGSAAAALAAVVPDIELPVTIRQGVKKGRSSILHADYVTKDNAPDDVLVAGSVRLTARGEWIDLGW